MDQFVLKFTETTKFSDEELFEFCAANDWLRIERNKLGQLIVMSPSGGITGNIHFRINSALAHWFESHPSSGLIFDSATGFRLPDKSVLSPDVSFIARDRWVKLTLDEQSRFPPLVPDFVIEVRSGSDSLGQLKQKMEDWLANGCRLAWLIDPIERKAYAYEMGKGLSSTVENFNASLTGDPVLPGFVLDLRKIIS